MDPESVVTKQKCINYIEELSICIAFDIHLTAILFRVSRITYNVQLKLNPFMPEFQKWTISFRNWICLSMQVGFWSKIKNRMANSVDTDERSCYV